MNKKHKNKQSRWNFEDILKILGLTKNDYELLVLELKRCKIMNQTAKRVFNDNGDHKRREAVNQLTAYIGEQNPNIYNYEGKSEGTIEVSFDKPMNPEELKKRTNDSYNAVKSELELSNKGLRSCVGEKTKIMAFEKEMESNKSDLEKMPFFRFRKRSELRRTMEYLQREQDYLFGKVERKMKENQRISDAKKKVPVLNNRESSLMDLATEIKDRAKEFDREHGKSAQVAIVRTAEERKNEDLFR